MMAIAKNPVKASHGAWKFALPWARSSPREAEPAGNPIPRKSNEVKMVTDPAKVNGMNAIVATNALGRT